MIGAATAFNIERARRVYEGIRDCWVAGGGALEAHDRLALVTVAAEARPAFYLKDVERADFFAITAPRGSDGSFALNDVKDFRIGWSRAAADVTLGSVENKTI